MGQFLDPYRRAIAEEIHSVCLDRNLNPDAAPTERDCRIDAWLPHLVALARHVGTGQPERFQTACEEVVCRRCRNMDTQGICREREAARCCLYRYLPLVYQAIERIQLGV